MANKFDDLLEHFGSNSETLNETVLVDKRYLEEQKRKAKAFDEIKEYVITKNEEIEHRKDIAESEEEFEYFNTLKIANRAIINKIKQLEDK